MQFSTSKHCGISIEITRWVSVCMMCDLLALESKFRVSKMFVETVRGCILLHYKRTSVLCLWLEKGFCFLKFTRGSLWWILEYFLCIFISNLLCVIISIIMYMYCNGARSMDDFFFSCSSPSFAILKRWIPKRFGDKELQTICLNQRGWELKPIVNARENENLNRCCIKCKYTYELKRKLVSCKSDGLLSQCGSHLKIYRDQELPEPFTLHHAHCAFHEPQRDN